ncbi:Ycf66 family protein [Synechocystis sp. PCC 7509]|uniref:Ycf66 family protein n=1 Tax=Synechocystis sp. PCC 7509 TaxID=927677 RepID=UPI0002ABB1D6|nr:Ycf66 family protein [Synechocystis sp. PCC 7509]
MLAYVLALAVGLGSFALYMAAFFFPEVHRKNDFIWSGVGLFYALVLWVYGDRISGGLLLGQGASVALLGWSISQTLQLRRQLTPIAQKTDLPSTANVTSMVQDKVSKSVPAVTSGIEGVFNSLKTKFQQLLNKPIQSKTPVANKPVSTPKPQVEAIVEVIDNRTTPPEPTVGVKTTPEVAPLVIDTVEITEATSEIETTAPPLTEEEAISQAVETVSIQIEEQTPIVAVPPHPPDPELVEAAIRDAQEKQQPVSPPDPEVPENPSPS